MSAPVTCDYLMLTEMKDTLEADIMILDVELQHLSIHAGQMYEEYTAKLADQIMETDVDVDPVLNTVDEKNTEIFQREFEVAQAELHEQEKRIEMEKTRKQTELTTVTQLQESEQKRNEKNMESYKALGS